MEYDFGVSVEFRTGSNSFWIPTPKGEINELQCTGIIDIGDDQNDFEKLVSLVHEVGHVIFHEKTKPDQKRIPIFEESLAWYMGYNYALNNGIEINLNEYSERVETALRLYAKEIK